MGMAEAGGRLSRARAWAAPPEPAANKEASVEAVRAAAGAQKGAGTHP